MRIAALDLGSNTSLLLIAEVEGGFVQRVLLDETTITKLGQGVHANRRFHPEALERMRECLGRYSQLIRQHACDKTVAVATSAARDVSNGQELVKMAESLAIPLHIIAGDREAELTYHGALSDRKEKEGLAVVDVGGGSTEIIRSRGKEIFGQSVDVGSVRLTEMFVRTHPIAKDDLMATEEYVRQQFATLRPHAEGVREVVAVAGTPTTLAALEQKIPFEESRINGYPLSLSQIEAWTSRLAAMTVEERERLPGMQPKRSDVIVAGSQILAAALRALRQDRLTVSTRGVRYGVALAWQEF